MKSLSLCLFAATLSLGINAASGQSQSPDQQQEKTNKPSTKSNEPKTEVLPHPAGPSPDLQADRNSGTSDSSKKSKAKKNNARQAHGTPRPRSTSSSTQP